MLETPLPAPTPGRGATTLADLDLVALRSTRRRLTDEASRARHWQRLVRSRIDLLVAAAGVVDDLAPVPGALWPVELESSRSAPDPPSTAQLWSVVGSWPLGEGRLEELDASHRSLSRYCEAVDRARDEVVAELVVRYSRDPQSCLRPSA